MNRQQKYPETETFHFYNANPKNRICGDCVARAVSTSLNQSWEITIREMTELGIKYGLVFNDTTLVGKYLEHKGWIKHKQPKKLDGSKYTGKEFCKSKICQNEKVVANIGGHHTVAIIDQKVYDIWDSTNGCIGNYWTME